VRKEAGYIGKIGQTGSQEVKAPNQRTPKKGNARVRTGDDLRSRKGK